LGGITPNVKWGNAKPSLAKVNYLNTDEKFEYFKVLDEYNE